MSLRKLVLGLLRAARWFLYCLLALFFLVLTGPKLIHWMFSSDLATAYGVFAVIGLIFAWRYRGPGWWRLAGLWILELVFSSAIWGFFFGCAVSWKNPFFLVLVSEEKVGGYVLAAIGALGLATLLAMRHLRRMAELRARRLQSQIEDTKRAAAEAERQKAIAQSELVKLRAQVGPHFLRNTLATVQYLIRKDSEAAFALVQALTTYLKGRKADDDLMSTLKFEFATVHAYLDIMKVRMGERLTVSSALPIDLESVKIPPFVIPTLLENAFQHGIEPKSGDVAVVVRASKNSEEGLTVIEVIDNGVGLQPQPDTRGTGIGLGNVRHQIRLLYGPSARLMLLDGPNGGAVSRLEIPDLPEVGSSARALASSN